jgi:3-(3-hydroxy-phenyl)propionate hydroxylase
MCQGVRDVANLCWKLLAVLRGSVHGAAAEALLDSYEAERKAHACELTARIKAIGAVICERDVVAARQRDAQLLDAAGGTVRDTPRQDVLPPLAAGLITHTPGAGKLFPQPRLSRGSASVLMDQCHGYGFRMVSDGALTLPALPGVTQIDLSREPETEGVAAAWLEQHGAHVALVRPDHYTLGTAHDAASLAALEQAYLNAMRST